MADVVNNGAINKTKWGIEADKLNAKFNSIDSDLTTINDRLDGVDLDLTTVNGRLDGVDSDLTNVNDRLDGVDSDVTAVNGSLTNVNGRLDGVDSDMATVNGRLDDLQSKQFDTIALLLKQQDSSLIFQGFAKPADDTPTPTANHAYYVIEAGTVFGVAANEGQVLVGDGNGFEVQSLEEKVGHDELAQLADDVKNDLIKFVLGEDIDIETKPVLTDGYYVTISGDLAPTGMTTYSSTKDFIPLYGAKKLHYFGRFGNSNTRLVFYSEMSKNSVVLVVPQSNREIFDEIFDIPVEAKYYRVTCGVNAKNNFKVVLIGVGSSLKLESFRYVGAPVYENDAIKQSNIIWNDGSSGVVIFNNWNEENSTFTSFVATSIENGVTVTQPQVTFNSNNQITNYPNFIISEI